jgi:hypothetical protein
MRPACSRIQTAVVFDNVKRDKHRFECIVGADREQGHDLDDYDVFPTSERK